MTMTILMVMIVMMTILMVIVVMMIIIIVIMTNILSEEGRPTYLIHKCSNVC